MRLLKSFWTILIIIGINFNLCWSACLLPNRKGLVKNCYTEEGMKLDRCPRRIKVGYVVELTCGDHYKPSPVQETRQICSDLKIWTGELSGQPISCVPDSCDVKTISGPSNCAEILRSGQNISGIYTIIVSSAPLEVYCDMDTDGGGWTVFQRRDDVTSHIDFYRNWADYKRGFGDLKEEFWLGLDAIYSLTLCHSMSLRVDLEDFEGDKKFALYRRFSIEDEEEHYSLSLEGYQGDAGDDLTSPHNGYPFSTWDNDWSDANCPIYAHGAWWYSSCHWSNLNGLYLRGETKSRSQGIIWFHMRGFNYSLKKTEMKIRPVDF